MENILDNLKLSSQNTSYEKLFANSVLNELLNDVLPEISRSSSQNEISANTIKLLCDCIRILEGYKEYTASGQPGDNDWLVNITSLEIGKTRNFSCEKSSSEFKIEIIMTYNNEFISAMWSDTKNGNAVQIMFKESGNQFVIVFNDGLKEISKAVEKNELTIKTIQDYNPEYEDLGAESNLSMKSIIGSLSAIELPVVKNLAGKIIGKDKGLTDNVKPEVSPKSTAKPEPDKENAVAAGPKFCGKCGSPLKPAVKFCGKCGDLVKQCV